MANIPTPITQVYTEINEGKFKGVKHFEIDNSICTTFILSNKINISKNRNFALSMPDYWLKIRQGNKWSNCITGLFKTNVTNVFKGDIDHKKHLVIFKFSDSNKTLNVYYFQNYYTKDLSNVFKLINN